MVASTRTKSECDARINAFNKARHRRGDVLGPVTDPYGDSVRREQLALKPREFMRE